MEYLSNKWPVLILVVIAVLAVALVFFYPNFLKILTPEKPTKFTTQDNTKTVPAEFPQELLFDLKEVKDSKTTDYINKGQVTAKQYEITYTSSRPFAKLVLSAENYLKVNNFNPIFKETTTDGKIETRRAQKPGEENLVIQMQKSDVNASEIHIIYTRVIRAK